jgi:hypothetical protein
VLYPVNKNVLLFWLEIMIGATKFLRPERSSRKGSKTLFAQRIKGGEVGLFM